MTRKLKCPTCGEPFSPDSNPHMPFCSRRCQQVDLQRWIGEEHGMPIEPEDIRPDDVFDQAISIDSERED